MKTPMQELIDELKPMAMSGDDNDVRCLVRQTISLIVSIATELKKKEKVHIETSFTVGRHIGATGIEQDAYQYYEQLYKIKEDGNQNHQED